MKSWILKLQQEESTHDKKKENGQRNCKNSFRFTGVRNGSRTCSVSTGWNSACEGCGDKWAECDNGTTYTLRMRYRESFG